MRDLRAMLCGKVSLYVLAFALGACVQSGQDTPVMSSILPPAPDRAENAAARVPADVVKNIGGLYVSPELERKVSGIIAKLRRASDKPYLRYSAVILNSPAINAFALPNGQVFITRGLLALANDEAELAAVIAHEMAHVEAQHTLARVEKANSALLASRAVMSVVGDEEAAQASLVASARALASFSRDQEMQADAIGIRMAAQAGYDPHGAARFLEHLDTASALENQAKSKEQSGAFLNTHPSGPQRTAAAVYAARQWGGQGLGLANRDAYLRLIDGMIYGDDPSLGVIRDNNFIHANFGFAFTAPPGFILENTADAVLGVAAGERALRFDRLDHQDGTLDALLSAAGAEDVAVEKVAKLKIHGFDAVTALGRAPGWAFRMVLIDKKDAVYRFIFVSQDYNEANDAEFLSSAKSFHALDERDGVMPRPQRVRLAEVQRGETPDSFSGRMATAKPLQHFLSLNGIDRDGSLVPGQLVKTISLQ